MANSTTSGEQQTKTVKSLTHIDKRSEMKLLQSVSSSGLLRRHGSEPSKILTDKIVSYSVAHRKVMPEVFHSTKQYKNNRTEQSHETIR